MDKMKVALAWAREHKAVVLPVVVAGVAYAARYVPGLPTDHIVNFLTALLST